MRDDTFDIQALSGDSEGTDYIGFVQYFPISERFHIHSVLGAENMPRLDSTAVSIFCVPFGQLHVEDAVAEPRHTGRTCAWSVSNLIGDFGSSWSYICGKPAGA